MKVADRLFEQRGICVIGVAQLPQAIMQARGFGEEPCDLLLLDGRAASLTGGVGFEDGLRDESIGGEP